MFSYTFSKPQNEVNQDGQLTVSFKVLPEAVFLTFDSSTLTISTGVLTEADVGNYRLSLVLTLVLGDTPVETEYETILRVIGQSAGDATEGSSESVDLQSDS